MDSQEKPKDTSIPGIDLLFERSSLENLLSIELGWDCLTELKREYLRYKPTSSCLCLYQVKQNEHHHLVYLKAFSERVKVEKAQQKIQSSSSLAQTHCRTDTQHNIVIHRYPFDAQLPALERLVDPEQREQLLERSFFTPHNTTHTQLTPLQYKPERRFVAKLTLGNGMRAVVKLYTPQRYQCLNVSYLKRPHSPFGKILGKSDKHCMLIYEWVDGEPLHQQDPMDAEHLTHYYICGQKLAQFHMRPLSKKVPRVKASHFAHLLRQHAKSISTILPQQTDLALWLAHEIARRLSNQKKEKCFIHGDFYAEQVLITSDGAEFLDFDNLSCWFSAFDLGNFLSHLLYKSEIGLLSRGNFDKVKRIFLDGYSGERKVDQEQVSLFLAIGVFQLIYHPLRFGLPNWQTSSKRLLTETFINLVESHVSEPKWTFRQLIARCLDANIVQQECDSNVVAQYPITQTFLARFKADKRALIEYTVDAGDETTIIGKVRAKGLDKRSWEIQKTLYDQGFDDKAHDNIQVPKPLFALANLNAWFQLKVDGEIAFTPFCESTNSEFPQHLALAIYKLHNTGLQPNKEHSVEKELEVLRTNLAHVIVHRPDLTQRLHQLLEACTVLCSPLNTEVIRPIHRDFYHDQVLWDGEKIYLIDFDLVCFGSPYLDIGNFIAHIQEQCLRLHDNPFYAQNNIQQFVNRYLLLCGHKEAMQDIEIYRLLTLVRHIAISDRIPQRQPFTDKIVSFCEEQILNFGQ
tara:strand:+ start:3967 stop:6198 length:2232 start_codon:yes stop_codon:yes gene_type:complete